MTLVKYHDVYKMNAAKVLRIMCDRGYDNEKIRIYMPKKKKMVKYPYFYMANIINFKNQ